MHKYDYFILSDADADKLGQSWVLWILDSANFLASAQMLAAFITAGATIALFYITRVLAKETKTLAKMTAQPFIVCSLRSSDADAHAMDLIIHNTGNAVAFDIKIHITPGLPAHDDKKTTETIIVVSMLPPGLEFLKQCLMAREVLDVTFTANIEWKLRPNARTCESLTYSLDPRDGFRGGWAVKGMHQLVTEVEKITKK